MNLNKIDYNKLNARQKENYNYHKIASSFAEYGYDCMRLNNDWEGADFIAVKDDEMIKVQLKGRFTIDKKYWKKDIYIAFRENDKNRIYKHDDAVNKIPEHTKNSKSWAESGLYSWNKTPESYNDIITELDESNI